MNIPKISSLHPFLLKYYKHHFSFYLTLQQLLDYFITSNQWTISKHKCTNQCYYFHLYLRSFQLVIVSQNSPSVVLFLTLAWDYLKFELVFQTELKYDIPNKIFLIFFGGANDFGFKSNDVLSYVYQTVSYNPTSF